MSPQRSVRGFTYRRPDGSLAVDMMDTRDRAETKMGFVYKATVTDGGLCLESPKDNLAAHEAGWRVVPVQLVVTGPDIGTKFLEET